MSKHSETCWNHHSQDDTWWYYVFNIGPLTMIQKETPFKSKYTAWETWVYTKWVCLSLLVHHTPDQILMPKSQPAKLQMICPTKKPMVSSWASTCGSRRYKKSMPKWVLLPQSKQLYTACQMPRVSDGQRQEKKYGTRKPCVVLV